MSSFTFLLNNVNLPFGSRRRTSITRVNVLTVLFSAPRSSKKKKEQKKSALPLWHNALETVTNISFYRQHFPCRVFRFHFTLSFIPYLCALTRGMGSSEVVAVPFAAPHLSRTHLQAQPRQVSRQIAKGRGSCLRDVLITLLRPAAAVKQAGSVLTLNEFWNQFTKRKKTKTT